MTEPIMSSRAFTRRTFALGAAGLGVAAAGLAGTAPQAEAAAATRWADRAITTYRSLRRNFLADDGSGLYREHYPVAPEDPTYSYEWPFSQAHAAVLDLTGVPKVGGRYRDDLAEHRRAQHRYWAPAGTTDLPGFASSIVLADGSHGDFFYDDNEWVGLIDVQRHAQHGDRRAVAEAAKIFDLVVSGWDDDRDHAAPGGVFWTQASWSNDRNTVSNMPGAELGLRLFQITGERRYLSWSRRMYDWTNAHLQLESGLYHDHLDLEGTVEKTIWSYNQGVPVGVNTLLWRITGEQRYLTEARRIAAAAAAFYAEPDPNDASRSRLDGQPPFFNSIYFKNLLKLEALAGGHAAYDAAVAYANRLWRDHRDPDTGLFHFGAGDSADSTQMIEQAAVVQLLAVLAWPRSQHRLLY